MVTPEELFFGSYADRPGSMPVAHQARVGFVVRRKRVLRWPGQKADWMLASGLSVVDRLKADSGTSACFVQFPDDSFARRSMAHCLRLPRFRHRLCWRPWASRTLPRASVDIQQVHSGMRPRLHHRPVSEAEEAAHPIHAWAMRAATASRLEP